MEFSSLIFSGAASDKYSVKMKSFMFQWMLSLHDENYSSNLYGTRQFILLYPMLVTVQYGREAPKWVVKIIFRIS